MTKRTAHKGKNAGSQFWSCTGYPECRGALSIAGEDPKASTRPDERAVALPHSMLCPPLHDNHEYAWFQYLTIGEDELDAIRDAAMDGLPPVGGHWRLEYPRTGGCAYPKEVQRALSVAAKMLLRGRVTLLAPLLEQQLECSPALVALPQQIAPESWFDSLDERDLLNDRLIPTLGRGWHRWVNAQVGISSLLDHDDQREGYDRRVDFLLSHPSLVRSLVIEVDGAQHSDQSEEDALRDRALVAAGYDVLRIPVSEVRTGQGIALAKLIEQLRLIRASSSEDTMWRSPIRRAGQIQVALLHAAQSGLIDPRVTHPIRICCDLPEFGDLDERSLQAVLADAGELIARVGALYGVELLSGGFVFEKDPDIADLYLCFAGKCPSVNAVFVEDAWLPFALRMQPRAYEPGLPKLFSRESIRYFLRRLFRKDDFREGQYETIERALRGQDAVVLLPTGAGKSIAFQLAAMLLPGKAIVVAPIIALLRDQIDVLASIGIDRATGISSDLGDLRNRQAAYDLLLKGDSIFYYVAPERFQIREFREKLSALTANEPIGLVVVDEAHMVSEWGHQFRASYLRLADTARETCGRGAWTPPLLALTGTASRAVLKDLQRELSITDFEAMITPTSFDRGELNFLVVEARSEDKEAVLRSLLESGIPARFGVPAESFRSRNGNDTFCGLVFTPWTQGDYGAWDVAQDVRNSVALATEAYSGKRPRGFKGSDKDWAAFKRGVERAYKRNRYNLLVCTNAFGMGIDKPNIRFTVHYGIPGSIEAFYQEAGRSGRDRRPAWCALIVSEHDHERNQRLLSPETPVEAVAKALENIARKDQDDVTRALFFETNSFKGVAAEMETARQVLEIIGDLETRQWVNLAASDNDEQVKFEKVLHRLVVLGVVQDYTVNYASYSFDVRIAAASIVEIIDAYRRYVAAFSTARSIREEEKARAILAPSYARFVEQMLELYLTFVYDVIEKGRRRALSEMLAVARASGADAFRDRVLHYLESTEYSERLEKVLDDPRAGVALVTPIMDDLLTPNEAAEARGQVARYLETYPDQPALLFMRALTEALSRDFDPQVVRDNLAAWMKSAGENYSVPDEQMIDAGAYAVRRLASRDVELAADAERLVLDRYSEPSEVRRLVRVAGVENLRFAPWMLLVGHTRMLEETADTENDKTLKG